MKRRIALSLFYLIIFILPLPTIFEAMEGDFTRKGWFVGAVFNWSIHLFEDEVEDAVLNLADVDDTYGFNGRFGYAHYKGAG